MIFNANQSWDRVGWNPSLPQLLPEGRHERIHIHSFLQENGRTTSLTIVSLQSQSIYSCVNNAIQISDMISDFASGNVFTFPSICVTDSINEMDPSIFIKH